MTDVQSVTEVAKGINDYGMLAMTAAFYLVLSAGMMVAIFKWFKSIINRMLDENRKATDENREAFTQIEQSMRDNNKIMQILSESLRPETQLRIRNLTGFAFDLSVEQVCRIIKKVREENHIANKEATALKIRSLLQNMHEDRKSRFDTFTFKGEKLSTYCNQDWIEQVAKIVENEIYHEDGPNNGRAYTNVKLAYDSIKTDFYHRLNN